MSSGFIHDVEVSTFLFYGWVRVSRVSDVLGLSIRLCWILEGFLPFGHCELCRCER